MSGEHPQHPAEEDRREGRTATERAQAQPVRRALAQQQEHQDPDRPRLVDQPGHGLLPGRQHLDRRPSGDQREHPGERAGHHAGGDRDEHGPRLRCAGHPPPEQQHDVHEQRHGRGERQHEHQVGDSSVVAPMSGSASEPVGNPVQCPSPVKSRAPTPLDTMHGTITSITERLARPTTSSSRMTATSGLPKMVAIAAADPGRGDQVMRPCGSAPSFVRSAASSASPAADGDQWRLRAHDRAERQAGECGQHDPEQVAWLRQPPARPPAGTCPPRPGGSADRPRRRPARRGPAPAAATTRAASTTRAGPAAGPDQLLQPMHPGEEAEGERRQREGEHGGGEQQHDIAAAVEHRVDVRGVRRVGPRGRGGVPRPVPRGRLRVSRRTACCRRLACGCLAISGAQVCGAPRSRSDAPVPLHCAVRAPRGHHPWGVSGCGRPEPACGDLSRRTRWGGATARSNGSRHARGATSWWIAFGPHDPSR